MAVLATDTNPLLEQANHMNKTYVRHLVIFVLVLIALNFFFGGYGLHISIIGSLVLTIVLGFLFSMFDSNRN